MKRVRKFVSDNSRLALLPTGLVVALVVLAWLTGRISEGLTGIVLGCLALVYAGRQYVDAAHEGRMLKQLAERVEAAVTNLEGLTDKVETSTGKLEQGLSTRYLGEFPGFLEDIVELIRSAKTRVTVLCDYPAYCVYSEPELHLEYLKFVRRQSEDLKPGSVRLVHLDKQRRVARHKRQFGVLGGWDTIKDTDKLRGLVNTYAGGDPEAATLSSPDDFLTLIESAQRSALQNDLAQASVRETGRTMSIYFWIADNVAIFALTQFSETLEVAFKTSDSRLIEALDDIFDGYYQSRAPGSADPDE